MSYYCFAVFRALSLKSHSFISLFFVSCSMPESRVHECRWYYTAIYVEFSSKRWQFHELNRNRFFFLWRLAMVNRKSNNKTTTTTTARKIRPKKKRVVISARIYQIPFIHVNKKKLSTWRFRKRTALPWYEIKSNTHIFLPTTTFTRSALTWDVFVFYLFSMWCVFVLCIYTFFFKRETRFVISYQDFSSYVCTQYPSFLINK